VLLIALLFLPTPTRAGFQILASFDVANGASPYGGVIMDGSGNLYGTTTGGGSGAFGTVFKIDSHGTLTTLVNFDGGNNFPNGSFPSAGLIRDSSGNLYGTTYGGGYPFQAGYGTIFKITSNGTLSYLFNKFNGGYCAGLGGAHPSDYGSLVRDSNGNLYGTTQQAASFHDGAVFKLSPNGTLTSLADLGGQSYGGLLRDSSGNLYGTTQGGGAYGYGSVFEVTSAGSLKTLYSFNNSPDGANPQSGLIADSHGNLYGTTYGGGTYGDGTVFELSPKGTLTILHSFSGLDGLNPIGGLLLDSSGNLYGTTWQGGSGGGTLGGGTVFQLSPNGTLTTLHRFTGSGDGAQSVASLITDGKGNLYGTTSSGGPGGYGTVFELNGVVPTSAVPEPSTLLLLGEGAAALLGLAWRCRRPRRTAAA
jgi:uncharacterized repeat protein (TIGR03803 family)